jgi:hypothetical protein
MFGFTPRPPGYVTTSVHLGSRALRLGILPGTVNTSSYSSARQSISLPSNATSITLSLWQNPGGGDTLDYREVLILDGSGRPRTLERTYGAGNNLWQARSFDLMPYRGQTVTLYFNVYNSGFGDVAWNYMDDVSVVLCAN